MVCIAIYEGYRGVLSEVASDMHVLYQLLLVIIKSLNFDRI